MHGTIVRKKIPIVTEFTIFNNDMRTTCYHNICSAANKQTTLSLPLIMAVKH
ncbi:MAG: hypothetical protein R2788_00305 [Saprospiraceae bacterium]